MQGGMSDKEALHKLMLLLGAHKGRIFFLIFGMLIATGLNLCIPLLTRTLMDEGFLEGNRNVIMETVFFLTGIQVLGALINVWNEKSRIYIRTY